MSADRDRLIDTDSDVRGAYCLPLAGVSDDGSIQCDPFVRMARALELSAVASVIGATGASDVRERAWRRIRALMEEIDEDATGPQDVVRQR